jgi:hypothetical protein
MIDSLPFSCAQLSQRACGLLTTSGSASLAAKARLRFAWRLKKARFAFDKNQRIGFARRQNKG